MSGFLAKERRLRRVNVSLTEEQVALLINVTYGRQNSLKSMMTRWPEDREKLQKELAFAKRLETKLCKAIDLT